MTGNELCDLCIKIMEWWSRNTPLSYGTINVLMFIIIQPLLILYFFVNNVLMICLKNNKFRKALFAISVIVFVLTIVTGAVLVFVPLGAM